nr:SMI1/KNR4 family protein [Myxococcus sp. MH1]
MVRVHLFFGLNDSIESCNLDWNLRVFEERIPTKLLPIGTTEGADKICLAAGGDAPGGVFFWDASAQADGKQLFFIAEDFGAFVASLQADDLSPTIAIS